MITFTKYSKHFAENDRETISISTDEITLGELSEAYNRFLLACGFQVEKEDD